MQTANKISNMLIKIPNFPNKILYIVYQISKDTRYLKKHSDFLSIQVYNKIF